MQPFHSSSPLVWYSPRLPTIWYTPLHSCYSKQCIDHSGNAPAPREVGEGEEEETWVRVRGITVILQLGARYLQVSTMLLKH